MGNDKIKIHKKKRAKYGRLYWLPIEADDISKFFLWRIFNKLGIMYIPFTLQFYDEVYLREDISKYSRRLINACRKMGITTYVVQEGPVHYCKSPKFSHLPLYADIFLCHAKNYELWVKEGMDKSRIKIYDMQKLEKRDYKGILFIEPFILWKDAGPEGGFDYFNIQIVKAIDDLIDKDVVFKPHQAYPELVISFLPPDRIIWDNAEDLIRRYDKVYTFSNCSIRTDCEMLGKEYELINKDAGEDKCVYAL